MSYVQTVLLLTTQDRGGSKLLSQLSNDLVDDALPDPAYPIRPQYVLV